jgi:uncharacterized protein
MADMKEQIARLYELQQMDTGIAARRRALRALDDGSASASRLAAAQESLASLQQKLHDLERAMRDRELRLKGAEDEAKTRSKQAYGGTIADPKQLRALEAKIAELGRLKGKLEEEILELMDQAETAQAAVKKQEGVVAELERTTNGLKDRHVAETKRLKREVAEMNAKRQGAAATLDAPLLQQYETLLEKTGGQAVAAVRKGSCTGCKLSLPSSFAPRLRAGSQLVKCDSCRRILFLPSGESPFKPEDE